MGGEFTYPKMGSQNGFDPQTHLASSAKGLHGVTGGAASEHEMSVRVLAGGQHEHLQLGGLSWPWVFVRFLGCPVDFHDDSS